MGEYQCPKCRTGYAADIPWPCPSCNYGGEFTYSTGSEEWDATLVANVVANCRQQIGRLRMKMPLNVALALSRADVELADCQAWMRVENARAGTK